MMSEKVRRSEWGIKDWNEFMPALDHVQKLIVTEDIYDVSLQAITHTYRAQDHVLIEAMRKTVEIFCDKNDLPLPWLPDAPDFSTWYREQCEEYIWSQKCQFSVRIDFSEAGIKSDYAAVAVYINGFGGYFGSPSLGPTLKDYQNAAAWLWEQVNK